MKNDMLCNYMTQHPDGNVHLHLKRVRFGGYNCEQTQQMAEELLQYYHHRVCHLVDTLAQQDAEIKQLRSAYTKKSPCRK